VIRRLPAGTGNSPAPSTRKQRASCSRRRTPNAARAPTPRAGKRASTSPARRTSRTAAVTRRPGSRGTPGSAGGGTPGRRSPGTPSGGSPGRGWQAWSRWRPRSLRRRHRGTARQSQGRGGDVARPPLGREHRVGMGAALQDVELVLPVNATVEVVHVEPPVFGHAAPPSGMWWRDRPKPGGAMSRAGSCRPGT
jgi:hypothetical protein